MILIKKIFLFLALTTLLIFSAKSIWAQTVTPTPTPAQDKSQQAKEIQDKINELQNKVSDLQGQAKTLSSQIAVMDNQIKLTEYRIDSTKAELLSLTVDIDTADKKIVVLEKNLSELTKVLINRIIATYEVGGTQSFEVLIASSNISNFFSRLNYLRIAQTHDKKLIYDTQQAKVDYANQKVIFEDKKKKVEALKQQFEDYTAQLNREKQGKQKLLEDTKGNEANYQRLLAEARAEYQQIQGIVAGNGVEVEIGSVNQGETIAAVISGASCNSTGSHLHFTVSRNGSAENPFNYLKPVDSTNDSGGDTFNPSGNWDWPLDSPIEFNQGYGDTWFVRTYHAYSSHNGIDISGSSSNVKAVKSGTLFRGSYVGNGGCSLRYVRIHQSDDGLDTFYLHVNYTR